MLEERRVTNPCQAEPTPATCLHHSHSETVDRTHNDK